MKNREQIIQDVNTLINDLSSPLPTTEQAAGWTIGAQKATLKLLSEIRAALAERRPIANLSIGRGLDHWGVQEGALLEKACTLSNNLREITD